MSDSSNRGMADVIVSKFNIVSSSGKQLKEIAPTDAWNYISLSESMGLLQGDAQFVSGEATIVDRINILNEMKLVGDEMIEVTFETPQKKAIEFVGRVYNLDVTQPDKDNRVLNLKFCSTEKITSDQLKISRAYRMVPYSDMAKDLFAPMNTIDDKKLYAEPTKNIGSFIVNNKSPIDAINILARTARSSKYMGANYIFFEQLDKTFQFTSIESLVDPSTVEPVVRYIDEPSTGQKNDLRKLVGIKSYRVVSMPNTVRSVQAGMYGSTIVSNDLMKRKVTYNTFDYDKTYDKYKSVNYNTMTGGHGKTTLVNNKNYSERPSSMVKFLPKHFGSFDTDTNLGDERQDTELVRTSQMHQINAIRLELIVSGDSQRRVGEVVEVMLPPPSTIKREGQQDELLSGRYLISKIKHLIYSDNSGYNTMLLLVKDSYSSPLPKKA